MSSGEWATIEIWGDVPESNLEKLGELLRDSTDANNEIEYEDGGVIKTGDNEARHGHFELLEEYLEEADMHFLIDNEGGWLADGNNGGSSSDGDSTIPLHRIFPVLTELKALHVYNHATGMLTCSREDLPRLAADGDHIQKGIAEYLLEHPEAGPWDYLESIMSMSEKPTPGVFRIIGANGKPWTTKKIFSWIKKYNRSE